MKWVNQHFEWMALTLATYRFGYYPTESFILKLGMVLTIVYTLKHIVQRKRPNESDSLSFPSGHSALAWFLAWEYNHPIIYVWASMVAYARVYEKYHWWSDVLFSIGMTYMIHQYV